MKKSAFLVFVFFSAGLAHPQDPPASKSRTSKSSRGGVTVTGEIASVAADRSSFTLHLKEGGQSRDLSLPLAPKTRGITRVVVGQAVKVRYLPAEDNRVTSISAVKDAEADSGMAEKPYAEAPAASNPEPAPTPKSRRKKTVVAEEDAAPEEAPAVEKKTPSRAKKGSDGGTGATQYLEETWALIQAKADMRLVYSQLQKASRADPKNPHPDCVAGFFCVLRDRDARKAADFFRTSVRRDPSCFSALNNLALCELKQRNFPEAVKLLSRAGDAAPGSSLIAQNMGKLLSTTGDRGFGNIPSNSLQQATTRYRAMLKAGADSARIERGWLLLLEPGAFGATQSKVDKSGIVSGGTGFVVAPGYVLTNRHVADKPGRSGILIAEPDDPKETSHPADVVAFSSTHDLALLRCKGLKAAPLHLSATQVGRATDVMLLGFPSFFELGTNIKTTRGAVTSSPSHATQDMFLMDCIANPGNSGGPVVDQTGTVVGIVTAVSGKGLDLSSNYSYAIPSAAALAFVRQHVPRVEPSEGGGAKEDWPAVDQRVSQSTVLVQIRGKGNSSSGGTMAIEDRELFRSMR